MNDTYLYRKGDAIRLIHGNETYHEPGSIGTVKQISECKTVLSVEFEDGTFGPLHIDDVEPAISPAQFIEDLIVQSSAKRLDEGKARLDLLSPIALEGTAAILAFGAKKYEAHNWAKGMKWSRCIASTLRHFYKFLSGEDLDKESGLPHIDHVACNVMFLQEYFRTKRELDDRRKTVNE